MKNNTINKKEIDKFSKIASEWWNPHGKFKPLHKFNPIRIKYIKDNSIKHFNHSFETCNYKFILINSPYSCDLTALLIHEKVCII